MTFASGPVLNPMFNCKLLKIEKSHSLKLKGQFPFCKSIIRIVMAISHKAGGDDKDKDEGSIAILLRKKQEASRQQAGRSPFFKV